ncbi:MAG: HD domain-containing protein [Spirochaetia bacterium]
MNQKTVSIIEFGSTAIRLLIAEIGKEDGWKILDRAEKPVPFGREVFFSGNLSRSSMSLAIKTLNMFTELLDSWGVLKEDVHVLATSALREARNRDTFIDRVWIQTGFRINVVEGIEENRLTYLAVKYAIRDTRPSLIRSNLMIIEVGGGSTELMLLRKGKMVAAHSLRIGTVRMEQMVKDAQESGENISRIIAQSIRTMSDMVDVELKLKRISNFIAVGNDVRLAARRVGEEKTPMYSIIQREAFEDFVYSLRHLSIEDCVAKFQITYNEAEGLVPSLFIYLTMLEQTSADKIVVPKVSLREGMLLSLVFGPNQELQQEFYSQVVASAVNLGRKFHFDEDHAKHVTNLALLLFDEMRDEHAMDQDTRLLLEVAGILHDIGTFIKTSGHHKHGQYIVANSEIFGLHRDDLEIISNIIRYHRKGRPQSVHLSYSSLSREERLKVVKLTAILRVADALDRSHLQHVEGFTLEQSDEELILHCNYSGDISVERYGLELKGDLFEEVFGVRVALA